MEKAMDGLAKFVAYFNWKLFGIIMAILVSMIILFISIGAGASNRAIGLEEQANTSKSAITIQEKRRADLIVNLVDTVKSYNNYEQETMTKIIEARQKATSGNIDEAKLIINAVAEQYPQLKSQENYKYLMTELSTTENLIAEHRTSYNNRVKEYNRYIRRFPTNIILNMFGYEKQNFTYLEFNGLQDSPKNLFE
jgi:LemA protein